MLTIPTLILMFPRMRRAWTHFLGILNVILVAWRIVKKIAIAAGNWARLSTSRVSFSLEINKPRKREARKSTCFVCVVSN